MKRQKSGKLFLKLFLFLGISFNISGLALANVPCSLPFNLANGTIADATQVMANYNALVACLLNAAAAGNNTDITSLGGLTTPLSLSQGGTPVYIGGTAGGSANAQTITTVPPFIQSAGNIIRFKAGASNTGPLTVNGINVFRRSQLGATMTVGGEIYAGEMVDLEYDGTEFQCVSCNRIKVGGFAYVSSANTSPDTGELFADGSCVSQTTYSDLFSVIGSNFTHGAGCNPGNFMLPDARGNYLVALDNQGINGNAGRLNIACTVSDTTLGSLCGSQEEGITLSNIPQNIPFTLSLGSTLDMQECVSAGCISGGAGNGVPIGSTFPTGTGVAVPINGATVQGTVSNSSANTPLITVPPNLFVRVTVHY